MDEPRTHNHTMSQALLYVGLDVHSQSISIAIAESGRGEVRNYGSISGCLHSLEKTLTKIKKAHPGRTLQVCYEAGPTVFVIAPLAAPRRSWFPCGSFAATQRNDY